MKTKFITLPVTLLLFSLSFSAQALSISHMGIKGGVNVANVTGNDAFKDTFNTDNITSFTVGGFLISRISLKTKIRTEILYTRKGADVNFLEDSIFLDGSIKMRSSYLEIPILIQSNLPSRSRGSVVNVFIGPSIGLLLSSEVDGTDNKNSMASTEIGLHVGGGITIDRLMTLDLRYIVGLTNISDEDDSGSTKNRGIMATVGYLLK